MVRDSRKEDADDRKDRQMSGLRCKYDLIMTFVLQGHIKECVRNMISQRGESLILHATTSHEWEAQLHRHIAGRDDCLMCRIPTPSAKVQFQCSTVPLNGKAHNDAALPFLSATAGILLVSGLYRLMYGQLLQGPHNWWRVMLNSNTRLVAAGRCKCSVNCPGILPEPTRNRINRSRRYANVK